MEKEENEFSDMIVGDFEDTYDNLPLKTFLGYQFYHDFCKDSFEVIHFYLHNNCTDSNLVKNSQYVAFIDDDTIVRFDEFDSVFNQLLGDEMICLRGNPIQHENPTYYGKYHIWYDQERFLTRK